MKAFKLLAVCILLTNLANTKSTKMIETSDNQLQKVQIKGEAQGTYYSITYFDLEGRNLKNQVDSILKAYDLSASNYVENSIICKVNRNEEVQPDSIFLGNFLLAQRVSKESDGFFDITVRPLVELWGFGLKNRNHVKDEEVKAILPHIGYTKVKYENNKIVKSDTAIKLDFNAIAQGYSVDIVARYFEDIGINIYLIDIGGEVFGKSTKPDGSCWSVGIEQPNDNAEYNSALSAIVELKNLALATSGNYRKFYVENGIRYSHTINPKTGYPVDHTLLSASVFAKTTGEADAYATVLMVMGLEKSKIFLKQHPELDAYLIYSDKNGKFKTYQTKGISKILRKTDK